MVQGAGFRFKAPVLGFRMGIPYSERDSQGVSFVQLVGGVWGLVGDLRRQSLRLRTWGLKFRGVGLRLGDANSGFQPFQNRWPCPKLSRQVMGFKGTALTWTRTTYALDLWSS